MHGNVMASPARGVALLPRPWIMQLQIRRVMRIKVRKGLSCLAVPATRCNTVKHEKACKPNGEEAFVHPRPSFFSRLLLRLFGAG
jgi:hypothetical protein